MPVIQPLHAMVTGRDVPVPTGSNVIGILA
jgi:hypothetical protein